MSFVGFFLPHFGPFLALSGLFQRHFVVIFEMIFWDHFVAVLVILGSFLDHFVAISKLFSGHY